MASVNIGSFFLTMSLLLVFTVKYYVDTFVNPKLITLIDIMKRKKKPSLMCINPRFKILEVENFTVKA